MWGNSGKNSLGFFFEARGGNKGSEFNTEVDSMQSELLLTFGET